MVLWDTNKTFLGRIIETSLGISCKTCLRRRMDEPIWRLNYVSLRSRHNIPQRHPVPVRRLGDTLLRRRWVFHLRLVWDVLGTYPSDVVTTFLYDIVETYQWDVLATYHWDVVGCFIWESLRRHWDVSRDVAATSPRRLLAGWEKALLHLVPYK